MRPLSSAAPATTLRTSTSTPQPHWRINKVMKPTHALLKRVSRLSLTTKQTNKGYYKGTGTGSTGRHTKHGGYLIQWDKVRTYVVPSNLKDFKACHKSSSIFSLQQLIKYSLRLSSPVRWSLFEADSKEILKEHSVGRHICRGGRLRMARTKCWAWW